MTDYFEYQEVAQEWSPRDESDYYDSDSYREGSGFGTAVTLMIMGAVIYIYLQDYFNRQTREQRQREERKREERKWNEYEEVAEQRQREAMTDYYCEYEEVAEQRQREERKDREEMKGDE